MKMKYYVGISIFLLISTTVLVNISSGVNQKPTQLPQPPQLYTHTINVGIDDSSWLFPQAVGSGVSAFTRSLNYSWIVDNQNYNFSIEGFNITLFENFDNITKYNVIVYAGAHDEFTAFVSDRQHYPIANPVTNITHHLNIPVLKNNLEKYIRLGGGWVGNCGGMALSIDIYGNPSTRLEENFRKMH